MRKTAFLTTVGSIAIVGAATGACTKGSATQQPGWFAVTDGGDDWDALAASDSASEPASSSGSASSGGTGTSSGVGSSGGSNGGSGSSSGNPSSGGMGTGSDGGSSGGSNGGSGSSSGNPSSGGMGTGSDGGSSGSSGGSSSTGGSGADAGTVGGVPGGQAGVGASISGCQIFPIDNPWNAAVDGPNVRVIHTYDSQIPQNTALHPDWGDYSTNGYGIPFNVVSSSQADLATVFSVYASESDPGPGGWTGTNPNTSGSSTGTTAYPFFSGMKIEGKPSPGGTPGSLPGDQHAIVLVKGASGCKAYEAWNCVAGSGAPFQCANGAVFDLTSNTLRPLGWTSADAAGLSILAGLVRLSEVQAGAINHALRVTFQATERGYILPATHAASSKSTPYPPMGLRLRLKAGVSTSSYTSASQVIMTAMKKYGLIVADNGSDWFFQGDSDDGWDAMAPDGRDTLIGEISSDFHHLTGADFEVIYSGDPITTGL